MHSKPFPRHVGGAWRLWLCALLVAALAPAPVRAAIAFTNVGDLGLPAVDQGSLAWGDYDLPYGTYYPSVQAVDTAFAGGPQRPRRRL